MSSAAGDVSDKQGKMGEGYNNLRRTEEKQHCKVGREEEGSSSNRPELAAFFLALRDTLIEEAFKVHIHTQKNTCVVRECVKKAGHHQFSQVAAGRAQQLSVHALPHACRRSSGAVRVPTNNQVELRAIQSQAGEGLAGR